LLLAFYLTPAVRVFRFLIFTAHILCEEENFVLSFIDEFFDIVLSILLRQPIEFTFTQPAADLFV